MKSLSDLFGGDVDLLDPSGIAAVHPLLNLEGVVGAMYCKTDGSIDPTGTASSSLNWTQQSLLVSQRVRFEEELAVRSVESCTKLC